MHQRHALIKNPIRNQQRRMIKSKELQQLYEQLLLEKIGKNFVESIGSITVELEAE